METRGALASAVDTETVKVSLRADFGSNAVNEIKEVVLPAMDGSAETEKMELLPLTPLPDKRRLQRSLETGEL
jgi:hypothetical protein